MFQECPLLHLCSHFLDLSNFIQSKDISPKHPGNWAFTPIWNHLISLLMDFFFFQHQSTTRFPYLAFSQLWSWQLPLRRMALLNAFKGPSLWKKPPFPQYHDFLTLLMASALIVYNWERGLPLMPRSDEDHRGSNGTAFCWRKERKYQKCRIVGFLSINNENQLNVWSTGHSRSCIKHLIGILFGQPVRLKSEPYGKS